MKQWTRTGYVVQKTRNCVPKNDDLLSMIRDDSLADIGPKPKTERFPKAVRR